MSELPKRKRLRIRDYDYSQNGFYFITICTHQKQKIFGSVHDGSIHLNSIGNIVDFTWRDLVQHNDITLHEYVIRPNHIHGIIEICREQSVTVPKSANKFSGIPEIIRQFKTFSSKRINEYLKRNGYEPFPTGKLWQKSYFEHIVRSEDDYIKAVEYIVNNPLKLTLIENEYHS